MAGRGRRSGVVMGCVAAGILLVTREHALRFAGTLSRGNNGGFASIWSAVRADVRIAAEFYRHEPGATPEARSAAFLPFVRYGALS